jgi:hypothetical protein
LLAFSYRQQGIHLGRFNLSMDHVTSMEKAHIAELLFWHDQQGFPDSMIFAGSFTISLARLVAFGSKSFLQGCRD